MTPLVILLQLIIEHHCSLKSLCACQVSTIKCNNCPEVLTIITELYGEKNCTAICAIVLQAQYTIQKKTSSY